MRFGNRRDREPYIGGYDPEHEMPNPDRDARDRYMSDAYRHNSDDSRYFYRWDPQRIEGRHERSPQWRDDRYSFDARDREGMNDRGYGYDRDHDRSFGARDRDFDFGRGGSYDYDRDRGGNFYGSSDRDLDRFAGDRGYDRGHDRGHDLPFDRGFGYDRGYDRQFGARDRDFDSGRGGSYDYDRERGGNFYGGGDRDFGASRRRDWNREPFDEERSWRNRR